MSLADAPVVGSALRETKLLARWTALDGLPRVAIKRAARAGDPQARLIVDPTLRDDASAVWDEVRGRGRVTRTAVSAITVDHGIAFDVLRSDDFRVVSMGEQLPGLLGKIEATTRTGALHPVQAPSLLSVEPPEHTRYRTLVSSVFTARAVAQLRDRVQLTADALLDALERRRAATGAEVVDLVEAYCSRLPVAVISDILGVPEEDRDLVLHFGEAAAPSLDFVLPWRQFRRTELGLLAFDRWLSGHIARLRSHPGDDLMSQLIAATDGEGRLDDRELRATAGLVLAAGFETTVNLLGNGTWLLARHPDQLALVREDPSRWSTAVDEALRLESPVQMTARIAKRDTELAGEPIARGEMVILLLAAANRDPQVFSDPLRFDVTRTNAGRHLAFSGGRHFCLGAALARAEGEVGLRTLFERYPDLSLAGGGVRRSTRVLKGFASLPVRLGERAPAPELAAH
ncbi:cytochrome P450 [Jatrophihabitans sp. YIM 134969]